MVIESSNEDKRKKTKRRGNIQNEQKTDGRYIKSRKKKQMRTCANKE